MKPTWLRKVSDKLEQCIEESVNASVALLLRSGKEREILLLKRAEIDGDPWSGDIAFPGGKKSDEDADLKATVLRETFEETGIGLSAADYLGSLSPVFSRVQIDVGVLPMVFYIESEQDIILSIEHTDYRWIPLSELDKSRINMKIKNREETVFLVDDFLILGLTFRILESFLNKF